MSQFIDFTLPSTVPGRTLHGFRCVPEGQVRAVLQLSHGMVEYIDRYRPLAEYLADRGILVTGHDHLGHGASIRTKEDYGYFASRTQPRRTGRPARRNRADQGAVPKPALLFARAQHGLLLRPAVFVRVWPGAERCHHYGHRFPAKALVKVAKTLCRVLAAFHGWHYRSNLVANLSFMGYNKGLEGRTTHDWLNRDQAEVDKYLAEERCTFTFTLNAIIVCSAASCACTTRLFWHGCPRSCRCSSSPAMRPGGRAGQGRAPRHPEPEGRRCAEH